MQKARLRVGRPSAVAGGTTAVVTLESFRLASRASSGVEPPGSGRTRPRLKRGISEDDVILHSA